MTTKSSMTKRLSKTTLAEAVSDVQIEKIFSAAMDARGEVAFLLSDSPSAAKAASLELADEHLINAESCETLVDARANSLAAAAILRTLRGGKRIAGMLERAAKP